MTTTDTRIALWEPKPLSATASMFTLHLPLLSTTTAVIRGDRYLRVVVRHALTRAPHHRVETASTVATGDVEELLAAAGLPFGTYHVNVSAPYHVVDVDPDIVTGAVLVAGAHATETPVQLDRFLAANVCTLFNARTAIVPTDGLQVPRFRLFAVIHTRHAPALAECDSVPALASFHEVCEWFAQPVTDPCAVALAAELAREELAGVVVHTGTVTAAIVEPDPAILEPLRRINTRLSTSDPTVTMLSAPTRH